MATSSLPEERNSRLPPPRRGRAGEEVSALNTCRFTAAFPPLPNPLREGEGAMQNVACGCLTLDEGLLGRR